MTRINSFYCFLLLSVIFLSGCQSDSDSLVSTKENNNSHEVIENKDLETEGYEFRGESGDLFASLDIISFELLVIEADLIAEVKVIDKIGEIDVPTPKSIFELQVKNVIEGDKEKTDSFITVFQLGTSQWVYNNDKYTFDLGSEYILFLKETIGADDSDYWILNEEAGLYKVLAEDIVVKLAYDDDELNAISIDPSESEKYIDLNSISENNDDQKIQLFYKEKFLERIKK